MNFTAIRILARHAALWCVLVVVVILLTLLFTVLGTITCAVLAGMMMGAARNRGWRTLPVSLVFPGVVVALVQVAKVELVGAQRILLPALCFGAFWLVYWFTRALLRLEGRPRPAPAEPADSLAAAETPRSLRPEPAPTLPPAGAFHLEEWQGKWYRESVGTNGDRRKTIIEISGEELSLSVVDSDGATRILARGEMRIPAADPPVRNRGTAEASDFRDWA